MKTISKFLLLAGIVLIGMGCEQQNRPMERGMESVYGKVVNEEGELLQGIRVEVYYDADLKKPYPKSAWDAWFYHSEEWREVYADQEPVGHTNEEGIYEVRQRARCSDALEACDVYVVAIDTTGIYERQVKKGQIEYVAVPIVDKRKGVTGAAIVDFVLKKKQ